MKRLLSTAIALSTLGALPAASSTIFERIYSLLIQSGITPKQATCYASSASRMMNEVEIEIARNPYEFQQFLTNGVPDHSKLEPYILSKIEKNGVYERCGVF